jgi:hypothetical protein
MRIEISIVHDDGERTVLGTNNQLGAGTAGFTWSQHFDSTKIRGLTYEQAWAASHLCMHAACTRFPVPTSHPASLAAAHAYHEWEQANRGRADPLKGVQAQAVIQWPDNPLPVRVASGMDGDTMAVVRGGETETAPEGDAP